MDGQMPELGELHVFIRLFHEMAAKSKTPNKNTLVHENQTIVLAILVR